MYLIDWSSLKFWHSDAVATWAVVLLMAACPFTSAVGQNRATDFEGGGPSIRRHPEAVPRDKCFPVESLPESSRSLSKSLLLDALDSEALYTIVGGLKPVSEGFFDTWFQVEPTDASKLAEVRAAVSAWQCGNHFETGVLPFQSLRRGKRFAAAWIASRPALAQKISEQPAYFGSLGIAKDISAEAVLLRIEGADRMAERWRGFGLVFGYPQRAIDFFVQAGVHHADTGEFIERDFRNYPTHARAAGSFVYAVPMLDTESEDEKLLRRKVEAILTFYRSLREKYIVDDNPARITELIRDCFDDGNGWCHPDHALQKALAWSEARAWVENETVSLTTVLPSAPLDDLKQLDPILSSPRIIALGESTHGTREFFQLKHRVFRHLVENHGVRLFGIEASYAACLPINEYVLSGAGDSREAVKGQGFWTWNTEEVLALVEWMRDWNRNRLANTEPVQFYGFDTQDAYTPLKLVLEELKEGAHSEAATFENRLAIALEGPYSKALNNATLEELDDLLAAIQELHSYCERLPNRTVAQLRKTDLLLEQAAAAIRIDRSRLERWSSIGMLKEIELYSRIRSNLPKIDTAVAAMTGENAVALRDFVRAAADLKRCQLRFRDELSADQRQAWRDSVNWGIAKADSDAVRNTLTDLLQFLDISTEYLEKPKKLTNARDESMARFVSNILELHGDDSRIAVWAHDWHISKIDGNPVEDMPRMGTFLERKYGDDYLPIGLSFGSGSFQSRYYPEEGDDPAKRVLREFKVGGSRYDSFSHLFDYHDAPVSAILLNNTRGALPTPWFAIPHFNRTIGAAYQPQLETSNSYYEEMVLAQHFEVVLHVKKTERARPLSPTPRFRFGASLAEGSASSDEVQSENLAGVHVDSVAPESLAERAGLKQGDRIIGLNGKQVSSPSDFETQLAAIDRPGSFEVVVQRRSAEAELTTAVRELTLYLIVPPWIRE